MRDEFPSFFNTNQLTNKSLKVETLSLGLEMAVKSTYNHQAHTSDPSAGELEASGSLRVQCQPSLHREFQNSQT